MRLLVIDTTGPACSVALRVPGRADVVCSEDMSRGQAERLAPMVEDILAEAGLNPRDLDRIGVTTGPGSFAGTRVGVAFARGLALATGADVVGISNLAWWTGDVTGHVISTHDARRGDIVVQLFCDGEPEGDPLTLSVEAARQFVSDQKLTARPEGQPVLVGSGVSLVLDTTLVGEMPQLNMINLLDRADRANSPFTPAKPFYARPPDAKLPGGRVSI